MNIILIWFIIALIFLVLICILIFEALPLLFGAPFGTTSIKQINQTLFLLSLKKTDKFADLGSGDGRLVIEVAKRGIESHGYEINPFLYFYSKIKSLKYKNAHIHFRSFWNSRLSKYNKLFVFQFSHIMSPLERKLKRELGKNSLIVSHKWVFKKLKSKNKLNSLILYEI